MTEREWSEGALVWSFLETMAGANDRSATVTLEPPFKATSSWPSPVLQLAEALYQGEDCSFALHDALLEVGYPDLAEHFRQETWHPKGCWVLDAILGKK